jgi:hypothetical protein
MAERLAVQIHHAPFGGDERAQRERLAVGAQRGEAVRGTGAHLAGEKAARGGEEDIAGDAEKRHGRQSRHHEDDVSTSWRFGRRKGRHGQGRQ